MGIENVGAPHDSPCFQALSGVCRPGRRRMDCLRQLHLAPHPEAVARMLTMWYRWSSQLRRVAAMTWSCRISPQCSKPLFEVTE